MGGTASLLPVGHRDPHRRHLTCGFTQGGGRTRHLGRAMLCLRRSWGPYMTSTLNRSRAGWPISRGARPLVAQTARPPSVAPARHGRHTGGMGRKSREKRERRSNPEAMATLRSRRAERRGRRVRPTERAYEEVARLRGSAGVIEALISRHNQRWEAVSRGLEPRVDKMVETSHVLFPMDVALWRLGVRFDRHPADFTGKWPEHLRWATDSACQAQRLLLGCNVVGAAAVARTQLERWTSNRTTSNPWLQDPESSGATLYSKAWTDEAPAIDAGQVWTDLSELLHGRGPLVQAARWEACDLAMPQVDCADLAVEETQVATQLALRQTLLCIVSLIEQGPFPRGLGGALRQLPLALPSEITVKQGVPLVWPLTFEGLEAFGTTLEQAGNAYLADVRMLEGGASPRDLNYSERAMEGFASRRARAAAAAHKALIAEKEQLGAHFDPTALQRKELAYVIINEIAGLLAMWGTGQTSDALALGASALRAAFWLWLEDDDRSLVLGRTVLEQTARLRTWRLKPAKAQGLEDRGERTTPRDWLDASGWRRLTILNRSLGEFAHAAPERVRWSGARETLSGLNTPPEHGLSAPIQTVRGGTLDSVAFAFGLEVLHLAQRTQPLLAEALTSVLPYSGETAAREIEDWLERCWRKRGASFGDLDFSSQ